MPGYVHLLIFTVILLLVLALILHFVEQEKLLAEKLLRGFCRLPVLEKCLIVGMLVAATAIGGSKNDSTNTPPLTGMFWFPQTSQQTAITADETNLGYRVVAEDSAFGFAEPSQGAVTTEAWRLCGGVTSAFRLVPDNWYFPFRETGATGLTVIARGEFFPDIRTHFFPPAFDAPLAFLPLKNQSLLPEGIVSCFWHEQTVSNSLILTWQNALYNRDLNCLTNFQAELFTDGSFIYRYPDHVVSYAPVFPFDWDGDGLENSVDPEPLVAGPDAHGTNAEWYNTVCSNVFSAVEGPDGVILSPSSDDVNTNAYYFVDVVAERGPVPIVFMAEKHAHLGSPAIVALAGVTNHVPLLIGVSYEITSLVPFEAKIRQDDGVVIVTNDSRHLSIQWPLEFCFTEEISSSNRIYEISVQPERMAKIGTFSWGQPTSCLGCTCWCGFTNQFIFACSRSCPCRGACHARGSFDYEGASIPFSGGMCRCGFDDPYLPDGGGDEEKDGHSFLSISLSDDVILFEDTYENSPGVTVERRSTRTCLTIAAYGGESGGLLTFNSVNVNRLSRIAGNRTTIPLSYGLQSNEVFYASYIFEGIEPSEVWNDVVFSGTLQNANQDAAFTNAAHLTVVRVGLEPEDKTPPANPMPHRHDYGLNEPVTLCAEPSCASLAWSDGTEENEILRLEPLLNRLYCPWSNGNYTVTARLHDQQLDIPFRVYEPSVVCRTVHWREEIEDMAVQGQAGWVGMSLALYLQPETVSFSYIYMQEIPCTNAIPPTGYFLVMTNAVPATHDMRAGAGRWRQPIPRNGGIYWTDDAAQIPYALPRVTGTNHWQPGTMSWLIPVGWGEIDPQSGEYVLRGKAIVDPTLQVFTVEDEDGTSSVFKYDHTIRRNPDGRVWLDGVRMNPTWYNWW